MGPTFSRKNLGTSWGCCPRSCSKRACMEAYAFSPEGWKVSLGVHKVRVQYERNCRDSARVWMKAPDGMYKHQSEFFVRRGSASRFLPGAWAGDARQSWGARQCAHCNEKKEGRGGAWASHVGIYFSRLARSGPLLIEMWSLKCAHCLALLAEVRMMLSSTPRSECFDARHCCFVFGVYSFHRGLPLRITLSPRLRDVPQLTVNPQCPGIT